MKSIFTLLLFVLPLFGNSQECYSRCLVAKFKVTQTGLNAPVITPYFNPNNYTLTGVRDGVGVYRVLGFATQEFTNSSLMYEMQFTATSLNGGSSVTIQPVSNTGVNLLTFGVTGALSDNVITETSAGLTNWHVVTIWRYKN